MSSYCGDEILLGQKENGIKKMASAEHDIPPAVENPSLLGFLFTAVLYCKILMPPDGKSQLDDYLIGL